MAALIVTAVINSHGSSFFRNALATLGAWHERSRSRRALARLSERDLHDIGMSWSSIAEEVNKPFWRD